MEITITGTSKEIAALVVAIQERQGFNDVETITQQITDRLDEQIPDKGWTI